MAIPTSIEENKQVVRRFIKQIFEQGRMEAIDGLVAQHFTPHSWGGVKPGIDNFKQAVQRVSAGVTDVHFDIQDMIAEDDKVAVRLQVHAKHTADFMGLPAAGREHTISETHIFRVQDGKVVEHWRDADMLSLMQQIGALPAPGDKKAA
ncbi:MAG TPA: ester cyclase [Terriglobales bacterium]|nr:ester cyclase [Terriglobales bacterium]